MKLFCRLGRRASGAAWIGSGLVIASMLALAPLPSAALELSLPPSAEMMRETREDGASHALPVESWSNGKMPVEKVAGRIVRQAWRISGESLTTLQLMDQLTEQLGAAGYETLLRCKDSACGGFDFRFAIAVFPPPEMFVDLFDYRYLSAARIDGDDAQYVSLMISRAGGNIYLQITEIEPDNGPKRDAEANIARPAPPAVNDTESGEILDALRTNGRVVLSDLDFGTGDAALGEGPFASLTALAEFLKEDSGRRVALVGHTDTVGGYDTNIAVSRARARAVMERLLRAHGVPSSQMEAQGAAYLAPVAPNSSDVGREANRRVEVVLLSGE